MLVPEAYQAIQIEKRENGVVLATLNRPEKRNAVDDTMHRELGQLPRDADGDPEVKVVVITGAGRAFCAGGDFSGGLTPDEGMWLDARRVVDGMLDCYKPIITAVNGYAMGLGSTVAFLGDVVFAARSATFADTHVRMGIAAGDGGQVIWPLLMGVNRAKYYLMTGERIPAEEAERLGLVNFLVEDDALMDRALELADRLAAGPAVAISASKVGVNQLIKMVSNLVLPAFAQARGADHGHGGFPGGGDGVRGEAGAKVQGTLGRPPEPGIGRSGVTQAAAFRLPKGISGSGRLAIASA